MSRVLLSPDEPVGQPSFELTDDQIATVADLVCNGAHDARQYVMPGMHENPITRIVRKSMKRLKRALGLTNLEIGGEVEVDDPSTTDETLLGRIDLTLKFLHQFGNEDAYVAIECKRVGAGLTKLNARYVTQGVARFASGQYSACQEHGFMLGYVVESPVEKVVLQIEEKILERYGPAAALSSVEPPASALALSRGMLPRVASSPIIIHHVFVDMIVGSIVGVDE